MTESDYEKCYRELRENLIGSRIKFLLSNKTVVFIGYSLEDEDFKKIWNFIDDSLGELRPHFFIVSPDKSLKNKLKDKNVTIINTIGSNFVRKIRNQLIEEKYMFDPDLLYSLVSATLEVALKEHSKTSERFHREKNPLLIYSLSYQDGIIHSLKRMLSRECYGEYTNPVFLYDSICSYETLYKDYIKKNMAFDASYLCGYTHAMDFIFYSYNCVYNCEKPDPDNTICLYYLPKEKIYNDLKEFEEDINNFKVKKHINIANKILKGLDNEDYELDIHHLPFL